MTAGDAEGLLVGFAFAAVYMPPFLYVSGYSVVNIVVWWLWFVALVGVAIMPGFDSVGEVRETFAGRR